MKFIRTLLVLILSVSMIGCTAQKDGNNEIAKGETPVVTSKTTSTTTSNITTTLNETTQEAVVTTTSKAAEQTFSNDLPIVHCSITQGMTSSEASRNCINNAGRMEVLLDDFGNMKEDEAILCRGVGEKNSQILIGKMKNDMITNTVAIANVVWDGEASSLVTNIPTTTVTTVTTKPSSILYAPNGVAYDGWDVDTHNITYEGRVDYRGNFVGVDDYIPNANTLARLLAGVKFNENGDTFDFTINSLVGYLDIPYYGYVDADHWVDGVSHWSNNSYETGVVKGYYEDNNLNTGTTGFGGGAFTRRYTEMQKAGNSIAPDPIAWNKPKPTSLTEDEISYMINFATEYRAMNYERRGDLIIFTRNKEKYKELFGSYQGCEDITIIDVKNVVALSAHNGRGQTEWHPTYVYYDGYTRMGTAYFNSLAIGVLNYATLDSVAASTVFMPYPGRDNVMILDSIIANKKN